MDLDDIKLSDVKKKKKSEVPQSCPTLCDPVDCNLPGSSIHGIFQARVLEWVAISFSRVVEHTLTQRYWASLTEPSGNSSQGNS